MTTKHTKHTLKAITALTVTIALFSCLTEVNATVFFQDDFESVNFNNWTVSGTPTIVTSPKASGNYGAQFPASSYVQTPFVQTGAATVEFYFQTDTISPSDFAGIIAWVDSSDTLGILMLLEIAGTGGTTSWMFAYATGSSVNFQIVTATIQPNTWYKIDMAAEGGSYGGYQLSINDTVVFTVGDLSVHWNPNSLKLGNIQSNFAANLYIDNVTVLNTANIPHPTPTPKPTHQPSSESSTVISTVKATPTPSLTPTPTPTPTLTATPPPSTPTSKPEQGTPDIVIFEIIIPAVIASSIVGSVFARRKMKKPPLP